jgi:hypothetical protein
MTEVAALSRKKSLRSTFLEQINNQRHSHAANFHGCWLFLLAPFPGH